MESADWVPWKVFGVVSKGAYNYALVPNHPHATKNGYVLEHRIVMENFHGRMLKPSEVVHHKNSNKKDNRVANLEVMEFREHSRHHGMQQGRVYVELKCPSCGVRFTRRLNQTSIGKMVNTGNFCSRTCSGKFSHAAAGSIASKRLEENIVAVFVVVDGIRKSDRGECDAIV